MKFTGSYSIVFLFADHNPATLSFNERVTSAEFCYGASLTPPLVWPTNDKLCKSSTEVKCIRRPVPPTNDHTF